MKKTESPAHTQVEKKAKIYSKKTSLGLNPQVIEVYDEVFVRSEHK